MEMNLDRMSILSDKITIAAAVVGMVVWHVCSLNCWSDIGNDACVLEFSALRMTDSRKIAGVNCERLRDYD